MNKRKNRRTNYYVPSVDLVAQVSLKNEREKEAVPHLANEQEPDAANHFQNEPVSPVKPA